MTTTQRNAIVIVVDGWQANMTGCFGNTWIKTPELDLFAAESFLFDQAILESVDWDEIDRSWRPDEALLAGLGVVSQRITDIECLANSANEPIFVPCAQPRRLADEVAETHFASLFAAATDWLMEPRPPFCLWLQTGGLRLPWDAPYKFRKQYADEDDPPPPELIDPPSLVLKEHFDPDDLLGIQQAYAGQISLLDLCLGTLFDAVRESELSSNTLIILAGCRGFPLGEHHVVGDARREAFSELIHFPLLLRDPFGRGKLARTSALVKPADLRPTLCEWFQPDATFPVTTGQGRGDGRSLWPLILDRETQLRDRIGTWIGDGESSLRTMHWHLRNSAERPEHPELYVKPDDRYEVNEVSSRCANVVEAMQQAWNDLEAQSSSGDGASLPPLPDAAAQSNE